jgi:two-component system, NtrC family, response regulator PilR
MRSKVLFVDDEEQLRKLLVEAATEFGFEAHSAPDVAAAAARLETEKFDIIVTDVQMPGGSGIDFIPDCTRLNPGAVVLVLTGYGRIEDVVTAMRRGAHDFLSKPISPDELEKVLCAAEEEARSRAEADPRGEGDPPRARPRRRELRTEIVHASTAMRRVLKDSEKAWRDESFPVLITGETGTGKELVARRIHEGSSRAGGPFVAINCAAIPADLLESELFGHEKGAFSGAQGARKGYLEQANGGTLLLDEIGDMAQPHQQKLLRALQEKKFRRVGSQGAEVEFDARLISATSQDLEQLIREGKFREDLYYRVYGIVLRLPPLRERREDIRPLAEHFLASLAREKNAPVRPVSAEVWAALESYYWPGNIRQLEKAMRRAFLFSLDDEEIGLEHLPEDVRAGAPRGVSTPLARATAAGSDEAIPEEGLNLNEMMAEQERGLLLTALRQAGGNQKRAAEMLKLPRSTFIEKAKRHRLDRSEEG